MRLIALFSATCTLAGAMLLAGCSTTTSTTTSDSSGSTASAAEASPAADHAPIQAETATLVVHGMGCPLCANNVDKQLLAVPGVDDVSIDLGSGVVTVSLAGTDRPSRAQQVRAIDQSGFSLVSITSP